jgi:hypothetical protein
VDRFRWWHAALLGAVVATIALGAFVLRADQIGSVSGEPYVAGSPTTGALRIMLVQGDGQAFAALAEDPTLARPERFQGSAAEVPVGAEAAYRAQRPAFGYLAWMLSFGQPSLVPAALLVLSIASASLLVTAVALLLVDRGYAEPMRAVVVLVVPGVLAAMSWLGPELAALGLATLGLRLWPARRWAAIGLFVLASLFRETALVVPAGLALHGLVLHRDLRGALQLAVSAVPLGLWLVAVHQRLGYFPWDAGAGRSGLPLAGAIEAASRWSAGDVLMVLLTIAFTVVAARHWRDPLSAIILTTVVLGTILGDDVWKDWRDIGRVLLPVSVYGLVILAAPDDAPAPAPEVRASGLRR